MDFTCTQIKEGIGILPFSSFIKSSMCHKTNVLHFLFLGETLNFHTHTHTHTHILTAVNFTSWQSHQPFFQAIIFLIHNTNFTPQSACGVDFANCLNAEHSSQCPWYFTKPFDEEPLILELYGMWRIPSLPLLSGPLWLRLIVPVRIISGSARGVMVIFVGNEHGDTSSNSGRDWIHFT